MISIIILFVILLTVIGILTGTLLGVKKQLKDLENYLYMEVMLNRHLD